MTEDVTARGGAVAGDLLELAVGEAAHGGWCVARTAGPGGQGKVVFVRHALPGERVRARVTSSTARFARAEAVGLAFEGDYAEREQAAKALEAFEGGDVVVISGSMIAIALVLVLLVVLL